MIRPSLRIEKPGILDYNTALARQQYHRDRLLNGDGPQCLMLLQHPPTITAGSLTEPGDLLLDPGQYRGRGIAVITTNRGGRATYHGPGQLIGYPILDLRALAGDGGAGGLSVRAYLRSLEEVLIRVLAGLGIVANRREGAAGVWVQDRKIVSVGVAVRRWVTTHGFALNVDPDLAPFETIRPCGFDPGVMTSIGREGGNSPPMTELEDQVGAAFAEQFGLEVEACELTPLSGSC